MSSFGLPLLEPGLRQCSADRALLRRTNPNIPDTADPALAHAHRLFLGSANVREGAPKRRSSYRAQNGQKEQFRLPLNMECRGQKLSRFFFNEPLPLLDDPRHSDV